MHDAEPQHRLPIIQYWHEETLPDDIAECMVSFPACNPDRPHLVFNASTAKALIDAHFGTRHAAAFRACGPPAMQADYFRYCAIYVLGGVYVDADCLAKADVAPMVEYPGHLCRSGWHLQNHIFGFGRAGHPLLGLAIEFATRGIEARVTENVTVVVGPGVFTTLINVAMMGSVDAFVGALREFIEFRVSQGRPGPTGLRCWLKHTESLRSLIEDHARLVSIGSDVHVSLRVEIETLVSRTEGDPSVTRIQSSTTPTGRGVSMSEAQGTQQVTGPTQAPISAKTARARLSPVGNRAPV